MKKFTPDFSKMISIIKYNSLGFFFFEFIIPYIASIELNATGTEMGFLFSITTVGYFITAPIAGSLADRYSKKLLILIGSVGRGIAYLLIYLSIIKSSYFGILIGNMLLGSMAGFYWIPLSVIVSEKSSNTARSEAFGIKDYMIGQGTLIGSFIGFGLLGIFTLMTPNNPALLYIALVFYCVANIYGGILFYTTVDEKLIYDMEVYEKRSELSISYKEFLKGIKKPMILGLSLIFGVLFLATVNGTIAKPLIIVYLTKNIESNPTLATIAYIPAGVTSMLLAPKLGRVADKLNPRLTIAFTSAMGGIITYFLVNTDSLIIFSILLTFDVAIGTTTYLVVQSLMSKISIGNRGKMFGLQTIFTNIGAIIGPIVGGVLWDSYGMKSPFYFSIFVEILLIPFYIIAIISISPHLDEF